MPRLSPGGPAPAPAPEPEPEPHLPRPAPQLRAARGADASSLRGLEEALAAVRAELEARRAEVEQLTTLGLRGDATVQEYMAGLKVCGYMHAYMCVCAFVRACMDGHEQCSAHCVKRPLAS